MRAGSSCGAGPEQSWKPRERGHTPAAPLPTSRPTPIPETGGGYQVLVSTWAGRPQAQRTVPPPLPSPLLRPEPTPIRRPPRAPASAPRVERSREPWTRTPLARTADRRFPTPQLPQGHPRCKEMPQTHFSPCGPNSSPPPTSLQRRAAGLTVGSYHTRSQPRGWHLGGDLVLLCPRGPRPQASVLPPSPRLDEMGARGRQPQPSPGAHARPRDGIPARAWLGQGTHRWTQA